MSINTWIREIGVDGSLHRVLTSNRPSTFGVTFKGQNKASFSALKKVRGKRENLLYVILCWLKYLLI